MSMNFVCHVYLLSLQFFFTVQDGPKTSRNLPENNPRMSNHDIMLHISETDTPHQINRMRSTFQDTYQPMQDRPSNSTHNQKMASMKYNLDSETFLKECHRPTSLPHYCGNRCQPYLVYPQTHIDAQHAYSYAGLSSNIPPNHSGDHHSLLHTQNFIPSHPIHSTGVPQFHCSIQHTPHMPQSMSPQLRPQSSPLAHAIHMAYRPSCILQHPHITMGGYMSGSNSQQYSPYGTEPKPLTRNSPQQHTQLQLDFSPANQLPGNTHHQHHFPGHAMAHQPEYVTLTGRNTPVEHDTSMVSHSLHPQHFMNFMLVKS